MSRAQRRPRRRFEQLENRTMLVADVVSAVVTNHNLTFTGDGHDDGFAVTGDGIAGDVVITGYTGADQNPTQINGHQNGSPVTGTSDGAITLIGVAGNITINLGAGDVTLNVSNLTVGKNLTISGGNGDDTIDIGTSSLIVATTPLNAGGGVTVTGNLAIALGSGDDTINIAQGAGQLYYPLASVTQNSLLISQGTVAIGGNLTIAAAGGDDSIDIGDQPFFRGPVPVRPGPIALATTTANSAIVILGGGGFATVGGNVNITLGKGNDSVTENALAVTGNETIHAGSGQDDLELLGSGGDLSVDGNLSVILGGGGDTVTERGLSVGLNNLIDLGSGINTVTIGASATVFPIAAFIGLQNGPVSVGGDLDVQLGAGEGNLSASNLTVGGNMLVDESPFGIPLGFGLSGLLGSLFGPPGTIAHQATITLSGVTAHRFEFIGGFGATDIIDVENSAFADLGIELGTGAGSLTIGATTTTDATILIGLGTHNTYQGEPSNSFARLLAHGLTPTPTAVTPL
jgi:hypothetical protein